MLGIPAFLVGLGSSPSSDVGHPQRPSQVLGTPSASLLARAHNMNSTSKGCILTYFLNPKTCVKSFFFSSSFINTFVGNIIFHLCSCKRSSSPLITYVRDILSHKYCHSKITLKSLNPRKRQGLRVLNIP